MSMLLNQTGPREKGKEVKMIVQEKSCLLISIGEMSFYPETYYVYHLLHGHVLYQWSQ